MEANVIAAQNKKVLIDNIELKNVESIKTESNVNDLSKVTITLMAKIKGLNC